MSHDPDHASPLAWGRADGSVRNVSRRIRVRRQARETGGRPVVSARRTHSQAYKVPYRGPTRSSLRRTRPAKRWIHTARFYGVTGPFFAKWIGLGDIRLSALDHRLGLGQVAKLAEKFHCDPTALIDMTHIDKRDGRVGDLISRGRQPQICHHCADRYAQDGAEGAVSKHWSKAWRITCPVCGEALTDTNEHRGSRATLLETTPFEGLWPEAVAGERIIEKNLSDETRSGLFLSIAN